MILLPDINYIITTESRASNTLELGLDRVAYVVDKEVYIKNMYNNDKLEENSLGIFIGKNNLLYDTIKKIIENQ